MIFGIRGMVVKRSAKDARIATCIMLIISEEMMVAKYILARVKSNQTLSFSPGEYRYREH